MKFRSLCLVALLPVVLVGCGDSDTTANPPVTGDGGLDGFLVDGGKDGAITPGDGSITTDGSKTDGTTLDGSTDGTLGSETGEGGLGGDADTAPVDEAVQIDEAKLTASAIAGESITAAVLPTVKGLINVFIDQDETLMLTGNAVANKNRIDARAKLVATSACNIFTGSAGADPSLKAIFPSGCVLNSGLALAGDVDVAVTKTEGDGGVTTVAVKFTFEDVKANGLTLNGTVTVSTSDLENYPTTMDLSVSSNGALTFQGTTSIVSGGDAGAWATAAVLNGSGTFTKAAGDADGGVDGGIAPVQPGSNGWACTPKAAPTYQVNGLTRLLKDCYANAGATVVSTAYTCTKAAWTKDITTATTLTWDSESPTTGKVNAQVTVTAAGADAGVAGTSTKVSVPWTCPVLSQPDAGPEAAPDADAADAAAADAAEAG